jgi:hypothetical protein
MTLALLGLLLLAACPADYKKDAGGAGGASGSGKSWGNAPDFNFTLASSGQSAKLSDYAGQPVVVNFWAVW